MTIEIHQPELEALIQQRIESGAFQNVEDVLLQALKSLPFSEVPCAKTAELQEIEPKKSFADFLLESPLPGSGLYLERTQDYPHPIEL